MGGSFVTDFLAGGISGAIAKTCTAPIERVKLIIQTQDANPKIISGEVPRYTGIVNCFTRVAAEQGIQAFWRGNFVNVLRYFPTQAFNFAFKDTIKGFFPKYSPKTDFGKSFAVNVASGGLAGAGSLTIVYPLDYARNAPGQRRRLGQGPVQRPHRLPLEDGLGARRPARPLQRLRRLGGGHRAVPRHVLRRQRHAREH